MSAEDQRAYITAVDYLKSIVSDVARDMISAHQQLKQAAHHNNMLSVQSGIEVLQRYIVTLQGAVRQVPPTPKVGSDFDPPVPYPENGVVVEPNIMGGTGVEDLSTQGPTQEELAAKFIRDPPEELAQVVATKRKKV